MEKNTTDILRTKGMLNSALSLIPKGRKNCPLHLSSFKDDRAFSLLHQELPQILVLCFP